MIKRIICLLLLFGPVFLAAQQRHALLIGIGAYPEDSGWQAIHGDNDIPLIRGFLVRQGFPEDNIIEMTNGAATKEGILSAMNVLMRTIQRGDVVYIQFSGHGQRVTDLNGDEDDGYDEAWIPYDAKKKYVAGVYEGGNHLIDDELYDFFIRMRAILGNKGKLVVVTDACHSGSVTRGLHIDDGIPVRGGENPFVIPFDGPVVKMKDPSVIWLAISACKDNQTNRECRTAEGVFCGRLTFVLAETMSDLTKEDSDRVLKTWKKNLRTILPYPQALSVEGKHGKTLF